MDIYWTTLLLVPLIWVIYQTHLSPLSKFPGPFWAKVNPLWHLYQYSTGERHKRFMHLHHKYGDIVRVGINELSVCNAEAQKEIYGHNSTFLKTLGYKILPQELKYSNVFTETDPSVHNLLRKQLSIAFSTKALDSMELYVKENIIMFCDNIQKFGKNGQVALDTSNWTRFLAFDILGDLCFGKSFGLLRDGVVKPLINCIEQNGSLTGMLLACPRLLPILRSMPNLLKKARTQLGQQSTSKIKERLVNNSNRKDFLYYLTDPEKLKGAPREFRNRLYATCAVLIIAGGDTTSTVLNGAIYLLATHYNVLEKLYQELIEKFPDPSCDIDHHKTATLVYLNAVIEEAMRLYPADLGPLPRISSQETVVAGKKIPPNCVISIAPYAISRDPRYFTNPESFIPERWIDPEFKLDRTLGRVAFQPFSLGPRGCIGRNMAYMEIRLFLVYFVLRFRPELEHPNFHYENRDHWTAFKPPLFVKFHPLREGDL